MPSEHFEHYLTGIKLIGLFALDQFRFGHFLFTTRGHWEGSRRGTCAVHTPNDEQ